MDTKHLYTFRMTASIGSFNQAAEILNVAQSTVSEHIKILESNLGVKLFNREGRNCTLTLEGELFLQYAQKMINLEEEIVSEVKKCEEVHGSLTIRIPETVSSYYLPPVLNRFKEQYPHVNFVLSSCSTHGLYEELRSGIINLAFLITGGYKHRDLETRRLRRVPLFLVTGPDNPLVQKPGVSLTDLKDQPVFATSSDCNYFHILEEFFIEARTRFSALYRIYSIEAIKQNIAAGNGMALLPEIAVQKELAAGTLAKLQFEKGPVFADMVMIWQKNKWQPPILEAFIRMMRDSLSGPEGDTE